MHLATQKGVELQEIVVELREQLRQRENDNARHDADTGRNLAEIDRLKIIQRKVDKSHRDALEDKENKITDLHLQCNRASDTNAQLAMKLQQLMAASVNQAERHQEQQQRFALRMAEISQAPPNTSSSVADYFEWDEHSLGTFVQGIESQKTKHMNDMQRSIQILTAKLYETEKDRDRRVDELKYELQRVRAECDARVTAAVSNLSNQMTQEHGRHDGQDKGERESLQRELSTARQRLSNLEDDAHRSKQRLWKVEAQKGKVEDALQDSLKELRDKSRHVDALSQRLDLLMAKVVHSFSFHFFLGVCVFYSLIFLY
jgi:hypothetical protein